MPYSDLVKQRAAQAKYQRTKVVKAKELLRKLKAKPCMDCGIQYPYYVMEFDHVGVKFHTMSRLGGRGQTSRIHSESKQCEVVCSNCHAERTYKRARVSQLEEDHGSNPCQ